ncbi:hypothetical protein DFJ73DRAFT_90407 [Zopfochytrium polystomum]|nr:hypothetical protein DFJ73DRAFT_90407 [Zopfochytrium polystomum]
MMVASNYSAVPLLNGAAGSGSSSHQASTRMAAAADGTSNAWTLPHSRAAAPFSIPTIKSPTPQRVLAPHPTANQLELDHSASLQQSIYTPTSNNKRRYAEDDPSLPSGFSTQYQAYPSNPFTKRQRTAAVSSVSNQPSTSSPSPSPSPFPAPVTLHSTPPTSPPRLTPAAAAVEERSNLLKRRNLDEDAGDGADWSCVPAWKKFRSHVPPGAPLPTLDADGGQCADRVAFVDVTPASAARSANMSAALELTPTAPGCRNPNSLALIRLPPKPPIPLCQRDPAEWDWCEAGSSGRTGDGARRGKSGFGGGGGDGWGGGWRTRRRRRQGDWNGGDIDGDERRDEYDDFFDDVDDDDDDEDAPAPNVWQRGLVVPSASGPSHSVVFVMRGESAVGLPSPVYAGVPAGGEVVLWRGGPGDGGGASGSGAVTPTPRPNWQHCAGVAGAGASAAAGPEVWRRHLQQQQQQQAMWQGVDAAWPPEVEDAGDRIVELLDDEEEDGGAGGASKVESEQEQGKGGGGVGQDDYSAGGAADEMDVD